MEVNRVIYIRPDGRLAEETVGFDGVQSVEYKDGVLIIEREKNHSSIIKTDSFDIQYNEPESR